VSKIVLLVFLLVTLTVTVYASSVLAAPKIQNGFVLECSYTYWSGTNKVKTKACCTTPYHDGVEGVTDCSPPTCYNKQGGERICTKADLSGTFDSGITNNRDGGLTIDPNVK